jgi:hypothetical protein
VKKKGYRSNGRYIVDGGNSNESFFNQIVIDIYMKKILLITLMILFYFNIKAQNLIEQSLSVQGKKQWDRFGTSVAIDYDKAIVGYVGTNERNGGYAMFYQFNGTRWELINTLQGNDTKFNDILGISAAISGDFAVVGARNASAGGINYAGAVYVFKYNGHTWEKYSKIVAHDSKSYSDFGMSLGIDGNLIIVGAHNHNDIGAAYIYKNVLGNWLEQAELIPSKGKSGDIFGWTVDINKDKAIVGAENNDTIGTNSGIAYIYENINSKWQETAILVPKEIKAGDLFGSSVSISDSLAIIGASWSTENGKPRCGAVYVYKKDKSGWINKCKITPPTIRSYCYFGSSVSLVKNVAIIGASGDINDSTAYESGTAYIYNITNDTIWTLKKKIFSSKGQAYDSYGADVSTDGNSFIIGAVDVDSSSISSTGMAYVYSNNCGIIKSYIDAVICQGEKYYAGGSYQTTAGTYYDTLTSVHGCDSIVVTKLSFNDCITNTHITSVQRDVMVFPNPTDKIINIVADDVQLIELYDLYGNRILSTNNKIIDLTEYNNGMYILRVHMNYGIKVFKILLDKAIRTTAPR